MTLTTFVGFLILIGWLFKELLPYLVAKVIELIPTEKEPVFHKVALRDLTDDAIQLQLDLDIPYTKLPLPFLFLEATIPTIKVINVETGLAIGTVMLSEPITLNGNRDLNISQTLTINITPGISTIKHLITQIMVGGQSEVEKVTLGVSFELDLTILGCITCLGIECKKNINLGVLERQKSAFREKIKTKTVRRREWDQFLENSLTFILGLKRIPIFYTFPRLLEEPKEANYFAIPVICPIVDRLFADLLPNPEIQLFGSPQLGSLNAGVDVLFSRPPGLVSSFT